jgi:hypothetical protein
MQRLLVSIPVKGFVTVALILPTLIMDISVRVPHYRDALSFGARTFLPHAIGIGAATLTLLLQMPIYVYDLL